MYRSDLQYGVMHTLLKTQGAGRSLFEPFVQPLLIGILCLGVVVMAGCGGGGGSNSDTQPPSSPSGLSGTSQDGAVNLSWSELTTGDLNGYNVYRTSSEIEDVSGLAPQNDAPISKASYTDTGAKNGTTYYYAVTAVDEAGNESGPSDHVEKTPFSTPPEKP